MKTISMEMLVPAASQAGPPEAAAAPEQGSSFRKTFASVREKAGIGKNASTVRAHVHRDDKTARQSNHARKTGGKRENAVHAEGETGNAGTSGKVHAQEGKQAKSSGDSATGGKPRAKKGHAMKASDKVPGGNVPVAACPVRAVLGSRIPRPEIPLLPGSEKNPVETTARSGSPPGEENDDMKIPVSVKSVSLRLLEEEKTAGIKERHTASKIETAEVRTENLQKESLPLSAAHSPGTGKKDLPIPKVVPASGKDPVRHDSLSPVRPLSADKVSEVSGVFKGTLRTPGNTTVRTEAGNLLFSENRKFSSTQRRKTPLTKKVSSTGMPPLSDKVVLLNGAKPVQRKDSGSLWFSEAFAETPTQHFFSSGGALSTAGPGKSPAVVVPDFGKQLTPGLLAQVQSQLHRMALRGREKITLHLHPDVLGKLKMNISLQNHHLVAEVTTDSSMTREILSSHVHTLKAALLDQGIRLDRFDVQLQDHTADGGYRQSGHAFREQTRQQRQERGYPGAFPPEEIPVASGISEVSSGRPPRGALSSEINLFV
ncbi:MAG: hypothetical protein GXP58_04905 [Deltaproteobacteria bacterium]|nr:hypothetical protein [Deltaproteobacteria bacterium]